MISAEAAGATMEGDFNAQMDATESDLDAQMA